MLSELKMICFRILDEQRWRLVGSTLENKAGTSFWKTSDIWAKREEMDGTYLLENVSKAKWLTRSGKLTFNKDKAQFWKEVNKDADGFFTLEVYLGTKEQLTRTSGNQVLTAAPNQMTLEGWYIKEISNFEIKSRELRALSQK